MIGFELIFGVDAGIIRLLLDITAVGSVPLALVPQTAGSRALERLLPGHPAGQPASASWPAAFWVSSSGRPVSQAAGQRNSRFPVLIKKALIRKSPS